MDINSLRVKFNELTLESESHWDYQGKGRSERDYVHGVCTYPAMMVPKMQREILEVCLSQIDENEKICLLDPFAGSGTVLVEGMLKGVDIVGVDINPLAILLCKAKTTIILPEILIDCSKRLKSRINTIKSKKLKDFHFDGIDKWFTSAAIKDLTILRKSIIEEPQVEIRRFFWAAFCEVVRIVSNSRDCTYKLHIKPQEDIDNYNKNAIEIFVQTLDYNISKYLSFYSNLKDNGRLKKGGRSYKGLIEIRLSNSIEYLKNTRRKFNLVLTSPPYGDNHTTVSYGQYSIMPLRWIQWTDIDDAVNAEVLNTLSGIDKISLGGRSSSDFLDDKHMDVLNKSVRLNAQYNQIAAIDADKVQKLVAFYSEYDELLLAISKRLRGKSVSVWTLGNRKIAKQEICMNEIMEELCHNHNMTLLTSFTRKISNKRMPELNSYTGKEKSKQSTMTREHILVFVKEDI